MPETEDLRPKQDVMNLFITKLNKELNLQAQKIDLEELDLVRKVQKSYWFLFLQQGFPFTAIP